MIPCLQRSFDPRPDVPADRLAVDLRVQVDLFPGERIHAVELVGPLGAAGVAVYRYPDEVASDRLAAGVE